MDSSAATPINKPIFVVGSPRSGTSILTWCLGQHPNIVPLPESGWIDRKSTRLNSSHVEISYAVFCLKKKKKKHHQPQVFPLILQCSAHPLDLHSFPTRRSSDLPVFRHE